MKAKGFTLIELLVVIAIIGLLSSIALASLKAARVKAADVAIKSSLASIRTQAEIYLSNNGNYGNDFKTGGFPSVYVGGCDEAITTAGTLFADPKIAQLIISASNAVAGIGSPVIGICIAQKENAAAGPPIPVTSWMVAMPLKSSPNLTIYGPGSGGSLAWCVDNFGTSKQISGGSIGQTTGFCP